MQWAKQKQAGFTIVELLIVVVVIAILAAITIVGYNGIQEQAQKSKVKQDIATLTKAVQAARQSKGQTLAQVTSSTASGGNCWGQPENTDLAALDRSHPCWVQYANTLRLIGEAAGVGNLGSIVDPWGRPYLIDENEGESGGCTRDTIAMYKRPFTAGFGVHSWTPANAIPNSGASGCAS